MELVTVALLAGGAAAAYFLIKGRSTIVHVDRATGKTTATVKGASGTEYLTEVQKTGTGAMVTVYLPPGPGHMAQALIQYNQQGADKSSRIVTWQNPAVSIGLKNRAMKDFEVNLR